MSVRTFIFCDSCNPQGIRIINNRSNHSDRRCSSTDRHINCRRKSAGRRHTDAKAWYEGSLQSAIKHGWKINERHDLLCPQCIKQFNF